VTLDNPTTKPLDQLCIDTIRPLAMDGVQKANSGHPGAPWAWRPWAIGLWENSCAQPGKSAVAKP